MALRREPLLGCRASRHIKAIASEKLGHCWRLDEFQERSRRIFLLCLANVISSFIQKAEEEAEQELRKKEY